MKLFVFFILSFCVGLAQAAPTEASSVSSKPSSSAQFSNIQSGNMEVGGNLGFSTTKFSSAITINPTFRYFVANGFSIGPTLGFDRTWYKDDYAAGTSNLRLGPSLNYYFWEDEKIAAYVGQDVTYSLYHIDARRSDYYYGDSEAYEYTTWLSTTRLGLNYFISPEVAFGPSLVYEVELGRPNFRLDNGRLSLVGSFGIFF